MGKRGFCVRGIRHGEIRQGIEARIFKEPIDGPR